MWLTRSYLFFLYRMLKAETSCQFNYFKLSCLLNSLSLLLPQTLCNCVELLLHLLFFQPKAYCRNSLFYLKHFETQKPTAYNSKVLAFKTLPFTWVSKA